MKTSTDPFYPFLGLFSHGFYLDVNENFLETYFDSLN